MNQTKEQWIDEVMNSLQDARQVQAPGYLHQRIVGAWMRRPPAILRLPARAAWALAAGLLLLVSVNVISVVRLGRERARTALRQSSAEVAQDYFTGFGY